VGGVFVEGGGVERVLDGEGQKLEGVPPSLGQVDENQTVRGPDVDGGVSIGEENDVRGSKQLADRLVLGRDDDAVLELLGEGRKVLDVLCLGASDVDDDDRLLLIHIGHVHNAALQHCSTVLCDEVAC